jgi:hypothetical protein
MVRCIEDGGDDAVEGVALLGVCRVIEVLL